MKPETADAIVKILEALLPIVTLLVGRRWGKHEGVKIGKETPRREDLAAIDSLAKALREMGASHIVEEVEQVRTGSSNPPPPPAPGGAS